MTGKKRNMCCCQKEKSIQAEHNRDLEALERKVRPPTDAVCNYIKNAYLFHIAIKLCGSNRLIFFNQELFRNCKSKRFWTLITTNEPDSSAGLLQTVFEAVKGLCLLIPDLPLLCSSIGNYQFSFSSAT